MSRINKREILANLNQTVSAKFASGDEYTQAKKLWESKDFQKSIAGVLGIRGNLITPQPKRNKSAYMFFCQENREEIKRNNPSCKPPEIMTILGMKWRELKPDELERYNQMANEDKERYYTNKEVEKKKAKAQSSKTTSYFMFCSDYRKQVKEQNNQLSTREITAELGKMWNNLKINDPEEYAKYIEKAKLS